MMCNGSIVLSAETIGLRVRVKGQPEINGVVFKIWGLHVYFRADDGHVHIVPFHLLAEQGASVNVWIVPKRLLRPAS